MAKRKRRLRAKASELLAYYGYDGDGEGPDMCVAWGEGIRKGDGGFLLWDVFNPKLVQELVSRGYDLSTMKFSISKAAPHETS